MTSPRDTDHVNDHLIVGGVIGGDLADTATPHDLDGLDEVDTPRTVAPVPDYDRDPPTSPIPAQRAGSEGKKGFFSRLFNRD